MTTPNVAIETIGLSAPEKPGLAGPIGPDALTRDPVLDQHLGRVGHFIGGGPEKAGNIAYVVVAASIIILIVGVLAAAYVQSDKMASVLGTVTTGCMSLITGALGFIFGKSSKSD